MNANELADALQETEPYYSTDYKLFDQAATMLRQQQEKLTKYELRHVAQRDRIAILEMQHKQQQAEIEALKANTLTDEQIGQIYRNVKADSLFEQTFPYRFAHAIQVALGVEKPLQPNSGLGGIALRKAQEK